MLAMTLTKRSITYAFEFFKHSHAKLRCKKKLLELNLTENITSLTVNGSDIDVGLTPNQFRPSYIFDSLFTHKSAKVAAIHISTQPGMARKSANVPK